MVACNNKDNLQLEKIIGKINIFVIIVNSLLVSPHFMRGRELSTLVVIL